MEWQEKKGSAKYRVVFSKKIEVMLGAKESEVNIRRVQKGNCLNIQVKEDVHCAQRSNSWSKYMEINHDLYSYSVVLSVFDNFCSKQAGFISWAFYFQ